MTQMRQFRVVYEYSRGFTKGAGAAFVIAVDELHARAQLALDMPGASIVQLKEEPSTSGPLAYERQPRLTLVKDEHRSMVDEKPCSCPATDPRVCWMVQHAADGGAINPRCSCRCHAQGKAGAA